MIHLLLAQLLTTPAVACGGFFCSSGTTTTTTTTTTTATGSYIPPVVQDSERILFQVNGDGTTTAYVEVGFVQTQEVDFAWVIPIPDVIAAQDVQNVSAEMFNTLETLTAPQFTFRWYEQNTNYNYNYNYGGGGYGGRSSGGGGCNGLGCRSESDIAYSASPATAGTSDSGSVTTTSKEETFGVEVIEEAVVGPFAIEVITAQDGQDFADWLALNGYDLPDSAPAPLDHYINGGMAFLGVQLQPDVPAGPIDTLVFTYPTTEPMIPIILTAIASANQLPITAYILADEPFSPSNYEIVPDFAGETLPVDITGADYLPRAEAEIDSRGGHAFVLEYATSDTNQLAGMGTGTGFDTLITEYATLSRWRGLLTPQQMTLDPVFSPDPSLMDYDNHHEIELDFPQGYTPDRPTAGFDPEPPTTWTRGQGSWLLFFPIAAIGALFRRRE